MASRSFVRPLIDRAIQILSSSDGLILKSSSLLNAITGYDPIIRAREQTEELDRQIFHVREALKTAQKQYESTVDIRAKNQRDINTLLERKANWTAADLALFTDLYKAGHEIEIEEVAAKEQFRTLSERVNELQSDFLGAMRERYSQEQLWSDKIRRVSTYYTLALLVSQLVVTGVVYGILNPRRNEDLLEKLDAGADARMVKYTDRLDAQLAQLNQQLGTLSLRPTIETSQLAVRVETDDSFLKGPQEFIDRDPEKAEPRLWEKPFLKEGLMFGTPTSVEIITEHVIPLSQVLRESISSRIGEKDAQNAVMWGLYKLAHLLKFLNQDGSIVHGNVRIDSIYVTKAGEWKLGGLEVASSSKDDNATLFASLERLYGTTKYLPPEVRRGSAKVNTPNSVDAYAFGTLIHELFNGPISSPDIVGRNRGNIPTNLFACVRSLVNPDPVSRSTFDDFLNAGSAPGAFFDNELIKAANFLETITLKDQSERDAFVTRLSDVASDFPEDFCRYKILPELRNALEYGGGEV
ncbi:hypothetical protein HDU93_007531 [Gonapodya sp. JEL0774]|nr:hypothetical protein HDU93_007531 [Gonapodya sp. JEL0774]